MDKTQDLADLMREEENRLVAEASTPERIAADARLLRRTRVRSALELRRLRRHGGIDLGSGEEE